eukprot:4664070-Amphidinium_carterae.1
MNEQRDGRMNERRLNKISSNDKGVDTPKPLRGLRPFAICKRTERQTAASYPTSFKHKPSFCPTQNIRYDPHASSYYKRLNCLEDTCRS